MIFCLLFAAFTDACLIAPKVSAVAPYSYSAEEEKRYQYIFAHPEIYHPALRGKLLNYPETVNYVYEYPEYKDKNFAFARDWAKGEIPLFLQWDKRWGYKPYCASFMGITACGPTSFAMVYNGLMQEALIDPYKMAQMAEAWGYAVPGIGTDASFFFTASRQLGLRAYALDWNEDAWRAALKKGHPIILNVGPGDFSIGGHFLVISGYHRNGFRILDPNSRVQSSKLWPFNTLIKQSKAVWAFENLNPGIKSLCLDFVSSDSSAAAEIGNKQLLNTHESESNEAKSRDLNLYSNGRPGADNYLYQDVKVLEAIERNRAYERSRNIHHESDYNRIDRSYNYDDVKQNFAESYDLHYSPVNEQKRNTRDIAEKNYRNSILIPVILPETYAFY